MFISGATTAEVEIVENLTRSNLQSTSSGSFINSAGSTGTSTGLYSTTSSGSSLGGGGAGGGGGGSGGGGYGGY